MDRKDASTQPGFRRGRYPEKRSTSLKLTTLKVDRISVGALLSLRHWNRKFLRKRTKQTPHLQVLSDCLLFSKGGICDEWADSFD